MGPGLASAVRCLRRARRWHLVMLPVVLGTLTAVVGISTLCCLFALPETRLGLAANAIVFVLACAVVRFPDGPPAVGHSGLEELWRSAPAGTGVAFDPATVAEAGRPYLAQAISPGPSWPPRYACACTAK